ncbi:MAG: acyl carrier protein [Bacteroidales bacterium]|nr:acyl carrier protein [Candidatus Egerieousia equi]MCQ2117049.1 acyl carrier protein [Bacteroidales bacterium]
MAREDIIAKVNEMLAEEFEVEQSTLLPDAKLKETLNLDSLSFVDLIALIQQTYDINIPVEDLPKVKTFNDLYDYIESRLK